MRKCTETGHSQMSKSNRNILLVVEGDQTETKFFNAVISKYGIKNTPNMHIYSYSGSIYDLYIRTEKVYGSWDNVDILKLLKEHRSKDDGDIELLTKKYTEIYYVFDFDYQDHTKNKVEKLKNLLSILNNETDNGMLLLNYPMFESMLDNPNKYKSIEVSMLGKYKNMINKRGIKKKAEELTQADFTSILQTQYCSIMRLFDRCQNCSELPSQKMILEAQADLIANENQIYIVNTSIFFLLNTFGRSFFDKVIRENCSKTK